jgi:hypothetical protein
MKKIFCSEYNELITEDFAAQKAFPFSKASLP